MSDLVAPPNLRLPSLSITGFRGVEQLSIPRLGRVTLFAGRNGSGKTTVLDAVRIYAARGQPDALWELLVRREELATDQDEDGKLVDTPNFDALFYGWGDKTRAISIRPIDNNTSLEIQPSPEDTMSADTDTQPLKITFKNTEKYLSMVLDPTDRRGASFRNRMRRRASEDRPFPSIRCASLGPGLLDNQDLARFWDTVALTDDEPFALDALRLIFGDRVERTTLVGDQYPYRTGRRVVVKLSGQNRPVPLKSLGDGATRLFGVALALANCRDGILLLDEAENGIHHSLQTGFWNMVLRAASTNNTQVLATTHSKDCINGFAWAALKCPDTDGNLIRLERENGEVRAVEYSKEELETAAEQDIEVR